MRVIVGLVDGADADPVVEALRERGAADVRGPSAALPDVLVAEMPEADESTVRQIADLPGVRYAEPDEVRGIL